MINETNLSGKDQEGLKEGVDWGESVSHQEIADIETRQGI